ncbi:transposase [Massilibacteroides sp.]|uniref:transposase n=1 Tax=Massilibacteroides sp. TaxID=2034766 RepID=UPI0026239A9E|nr:transposase [Massilibacteroides sp.]MDD4513955.1 hypothetical protein [Massilibacteroides sp.]
MKLSPIGIIANILWYEIKNHAPNIQLDQFVVMPNHIHGILILPPNDNNGVVAVVEARHALPLRNENNISGNCNFEYGQQRFRNPGKNTVSSIIGGYKSAVTKHAHRLGFEFAWQTRFHDHIVRNEESFKRIAKYIAENPAKWGDDQFHQ